MIKDLAILALGCWFIVGFGAFGLGAITLLGIGFTIAAVVACLVKEVQKK
jgi:hypothetical protein